MSPQDQPLQNSAPLSVGGVSHAMLVEVAGRWLRKQCAVAITELATSREEPDAIGWRGWTSILVECKATREDYRADALKYFRREPERGIGVLRYYLSLPGVIAPDSLPDGWGLLELTGSRVRKIRESGRFGANARHEIAILISTIRRIGSNAPKGVSIRCYTIETNSRATLCVQGSGVHATQTPVDSPQPKGSSAASAQKAGQQ